ncbi:MAG: HAD-IIB family hydrolase [Clostridia bacterium]|nr:HAD-IIB family hydrolase [Clostridia bacterium]
MSTKYIFLDIDGTLVDFNCTMPKSCETALRMAQKNGHKLIISTGRFVGQIYPWLLEMIPFDGIISSSGAIVHYGGECIYSKFFSRNDLAYLSDCFDTAGAYSCRQLRTHLVSDERNLKGIYDVFGRAGVAKESVESLMGDVEIADMNSLGNVEKVIYYDSKFTLDEMRKLLGDSYNIDPFSFKDMPATCGEVNLADVNKAHGMAELLKYVGADVRDSIAIGDGGNDITIIRAAGVGVAMGNATDEIKSAADMITDDIGEDGVYNAFVRLSLI